MEKPELGFTSVIMKGKYSTSKQYQGDNIRYKESVVIFSSLTIP